MSESLPETLPIANAEEKLSEGPDTPSDAESQPIQVPPYSAFPPSRRRFILTITTIAGFFGPLAGGIYLPALPVLENDFNVSATAINVSVSVFMAVFAVGPLLWSSFSDWKGRRPLYIMSIVIYILANVLLAAVPSNFGALLVLRMVQAFGSSAVVSMGAGTVADVTEMKQRAAAMGVFLLGPQCGPVLGPVLGGLFAGLTSWRWIFGFLAISGFCLWVIIIFTLPETLRARVGNGSIYAGKSWLQFPITLFTPPRLFCYLPIGIVSFNTAIIFATYYCIAVHLPLALQSTYNWSITAVGFAFLAVGLAMILGSTCGGRFSDWRRKRAVTASPTGNVDPENRLVDQIWGVLLCVAGCLMYGWFLHFAIHPAAVLLATFFTGLGMSWVFVATTAFLTECVKQQAAGAFALGNLLRNPAAALGAVLIQPLVSAMGVGWCFTGLAITNLVLVGSGVILLRIKCPAWRKEREEQIARARAKTALTEKS